MLTYFSTNTVNAQSNESNTVKIKALTFNILHGATTKGNFDLDVLAALIVKASPDFVALQEVDNKTNRAKKLDLVTELALKTNMNGIFGRAMYFDEGEYGEGVLSKYSFISTRTISLPHLPTSEPRAALEVTVALPSNDTITFVGTHLDHLNADTDRVNQAAKLATTLKKNTYPTILAGDLNDVPESKTLTILEIIFDRSFQNNQYDFTYSSSKPEKKIDYVMGRKKDNWKVIDSETICDTVASDHCAVLVTLELSSIKN